MSDFVKLSELVDQQFTVLHVQGYKWKKWDAANGQMLISDTYVKGYQKKYQVETNRGILDLGTGQMGDLLEAVFKNGVADLNGKTFQVANNGEADWKKLRYFF